jgi:hypothetical protein
MHKSAHPPGCRKGAYSQFLRLRRNCTNINDYERHAKNLTEAYVSRGYKLPELISSREKVKNLNREELLQVKEKTKSDNLVCTLPYNLRNVDAKKIILDNWHILSEAPHLEDLFKDPPTFGYTRPKNFKDLLCKATVRYPPDSVSTRDALNFIYEADPCTRRNCRWCARLDPRRRITSTATKERHKKLPHGQIDCETCNLIYLITCHSCQKQYVGETKRSFRTRISEHDRDIRFKKDTNISRHFNSLSHDWPSSRLDIIEHLPGDPDELSNHRLKRETYWIATLRSLAPIGLNAMIGRQFQT